MFSIMEVRGVYNVLVSSWDSNSESSTVDVEVGLGIGC